MTPADRLRVLVPLVLDALWSWPVTQERPLAEARVADPEQVTSDPRYRVVLQAFGGARDDLERVLWLIDHPDATEFET